MKVTLQPSLLRWARERSRLSEGELARSLSTTPERVVAWETDGAITYQRAQKLAKRTRVPFGYLFLEQPPAEELPIADFRTLSSQSLKAPSPELLDILYDALRKQAWYRDYLIEIGAEKLGFIGSATMEEAPTAVAERIRAEFAVDSSLRAKAASWQKALATMFEQLEGRGVLVLRSGIASGNTHRPLRVEEARGFAISDDYAPVIFVNSQDSQAAQMFTLIHELAHLYLGTSGVSNLELHQQTREVEVFCNKVAAEVLVPGDELRSIWNRVEGRADIIAFMTRYFKVSSLVILRKLLDEEMLDRATFLHLYREEEARFRLSRAKRSGGDYYATQEVRTGRRFARALIGNALEGKTPYREAYSLLGIRKSETFKTFARNLDFKI